MTVRSLSIAALVVLWLLRVPSIAQPMAADQALYAYAGQQLASGHAPYAAAWDQKPPGIHYIYAALWTVWPHESAVPTTDLVVAGLVAWLLVIIGRRRFTEGIGLGAAAVFLFFANPSLVQRLSGVYVRAQCETFIALAITAALVLAAAPRRRIRHLIGIGLLLGCAFWLKYNAAPYALTIVAAILIWPRDGEPSWQVGLREIAQVAGVGALTVVVPIVAMAAAGAMQDLYLATVSYNLAYSGETYEHITPLRYLFTFPIERAANDALWMLGGLGALFTLVSSMRDPRNERALCSLVILSWVVAACLAIVIIGARDLAQYFVQAAPALALMAAVGLAPLFSRGRARPIMPVVSLLVLGAMSLRQGEWGHLPKLVDNTRSDWNALVGTTDRQAYLARFGGGREFDKFVALEVDTLAASIRSTTPPNEAIYVFGFSPGVLLKSGRRSASRFHWSRPIVMGFAEGKPGYGSASLLEDLSRERPSIVALQKQDWGRPDGVGEPNSNVFFRRHPGLGPWLQTGYALERETPLFEVWRRR